MSDGTRGEEWSFVDGLEALLPHMRAFARSLCQDATLADDIVQSACLKAWAASDSFDRSAPMRPWLLRIVRNEYLQHCRRAWRNVDVDSEYLEDALVDQCTAELQSDASRAIKAIYALPVKQRDAIILVLAAGLTYDEAGDVMNCSAGTVKSRVNRARSILMQDLTHGASDDGLAQGKMLPVTAHMQQLVLHAESLISKAA